MNLSTLSPKNLPTDANKCRILLLLKLMNTSAAVILPWFSASSQSDKADATRIFLED